VKAKDKGTGKEQHITIQSSNLSEDEINKMKNEAELHEEEDKKKKETVEAKNEADTLVYSTEKLISDLGEKISDTEKAKLNEEMEEVKKAVAADDIDNIKTATEKLTASLQEFSSRLYSQAGAEGAAPQDESGTASGSAQEETVDAEFSDQGEV
jgi:molecular chaperone DnaK